MSSENDLPVSTADPADVEEQQRPLVPDDDSAGTPAGPGDPDPTWEADPADRAEQLAEVGGEEEYER
jgi:hypothetical protein